MKFGLFARGARLTGQKPHQMALQAVGVTNTQVGGGTRTNKVAHRWYADMFKACVRKISPRKHRILGPGSGEQHYKLARKGDPGSLRLELAGRLRPTGAQAPASALPQSAARPVAAPVSAPVSEPVAQAGAAPPTVQDRVKVIHERSQAIQSARADLTSPDVKKQIQGRSAEAALTAAILEDYRFLADPKTADELDGSAQTLSQLRQKLAQQLIALKLPDSARAYFEGDSVKSLLDQNCEDLALDRLKLMGGELPSLEESLRPADRGATKPLGAWQL